MKFQWAFTSSAHALKMLNILKALAAYATFKEQSSYNR